MRFIPTAEEANELLYELRLTADYHQRGAIQVLLSEEKYRHALINYRTEYKQNKHHFLMLKEKLPLFIKYNGERIKPITQSSLIVHMLAIPLSQVPLYINSKEERVQIIALWRLKKGK